jgi:hypothetical protein
MHYPIEGWSNLGGNAIWELFLTQRYWSLLLLLLVPGFLHPLRPRRRFVGLTVCALKV